VIGQVTSGGPAPTVGGAVGLAYVPTAISEPGAVITLRQRDQLLAAEVVKGPFYKRPDPSHLTDQPAKDRRRDDHPRDPQNLIYTKDHEWIRRDGADHIVLGITAHAVDQLGDITMVTPGGSARGSAPKTSPARSTP
jgi:hypothetical protein